MNAVEASAGVYCALPAKLADSVVMPAAPLGVSSQLAVPDPSVTPSQLPPATSKWTDTAPIAADGCNDTSVSTARTVTAAPGSALAGLGSSDKNVTCLPAA